MLRKSMMRGLGLAAVLAIAFFPAPARTQQQDNLTGVATITNTARVPGTVTQIGTRATTAKGVFCTFYQSAEVGSPSSVVSVEAEDSASGQWQALGSSSAVSIASGTNASILVYPGAVATSVPTGLTVVGLHIPAIWRLKQVITGGTSSTGSANCDLLN